MLSLFTELLLGISGTRLVIAVFCVLGTHSHLVSQRLRVILAEFIEGWRQAHQDDAANHLQSGSERDTIKVHVAGDTGNRHGHGHMAV